MHGQFQFLSRPAELAARLAALTAGVT